MVASDTWLSAGELAERSGVGPELIERYTDAGILVPGDGGYTRKDVARVRVAVACGSSPSVAPS